ncbi:hypothetical protein EVAR_7835_1 [Eumeta japonica]|uniref:Uncharacterized protein n=1 Tax=Eumeta variegata TaxID=151549 RepID=A0A4C1TUY9_EUMVA|nr:hypothetical protein EVAR_7835_1 [Eumeta japonica]
MPPKLRVPNALCVLGRTEKGLVAGGQRRGGRRARTAAARCAFTRRALGAATPSAGSEPSTSIQFYEEYCNVHFFRYACRLSPLF